LNWRHSSFARRRSAQGLQGETPGVGHSLHQHAALRWCEPLQSRVDLTLLGPQQHLLHRLQALPLRRDTPPNLSSGCRFSQLCATTQVPPIVPPTRLSCIHPCTVSTASSRRSHMCPSSERTATSAGRGGYDYHSRVIRRHWPQHSPQRGHAAVVVPALWCFQKGHATGDGGGVR
jgi:hypothetical protein